MEEVGGALFLKKTKKKSLPYLSNQKERKECSIK
jgi:hypothetical protein